MGRAGRAAIANDLPRLRAEWQLDFVVVNGENATAGMGLSGDHAKLILDAGADVVTLGDHAFDQKDMLTFITNEQRIIRPLNFSKSAPGVGARVFTAPGGRKVLVTQVLGQVFMKRPFDDPFSALDTVLKTHPLGGLASAIIVEHTVCVLLPGLALNKLERQRRGIINQGNKNRARSKICRTS